MNATAEQSALLAALNDIHRRASLCKQIAPSMQAAENSIGPVAAQKYAVEKTVLNILAVAEQAIAKAYGGTHDHDR